MNKPASGSIRLEGVEVRFPDLVIKADVRVDQGTVLAIVGPSGSGKSTLLNLIAGFEMPDAGRLWIGGTDVTATGPAARNVSMIFQDNNLFAHLDVATNVGLGISPSLSLAARDHARVDDALRNVGLAGFGKRRPPTLSGGERQRVALARALVRQRPILLLDEPFAALDPGMRGEMRGLLSALHQRLHATILLVTHDPEDVKALAHRVLFMDSGGIAVDAPLAEFLDQEDNPAIARFLGR